MKKILTISFILASSFFYSSDYLQVLHSFDGLDGADPWGSLTLVDDILYGRTTVGGNEDKGVIFSMNLDGSNYVPFYSFSSGSDNETGNQPHHVSMLFIGNTLYGATLKGGTNSNGTLFSIKPDGSNYTVLHEFLGSPDGSASHSLMRLIGSTFYGMTAKGGVNDTGVIYRMNTNGSNYEVILSFEASPNTTGSEPHDLFTLSSNEKALFGMTRLDGSYEGGTIFALTDFFSTTPIYSVLHEFGSFGGDGLTPYHGFLVLYKNSLYGMTTLGGLNGDGVIFRINESGSNYQILHNFGENVLNDGLQPHGSLALSKYNIFYGLTNIGGEYGYGALFQILPDGTYYSVLESFNGAENGANPLDNVIISNDGLTLYGMTQYGGAYDPTLSNEYGTIFAYQLPLTSFPPPIQALFDEDSSLVALRSLATMGLQGILGQESALIERLSNFREAYFNRELSGLTASTDLVYGSPQKHRLKTFQKNINFNVVTTYQHSKLFSDSGVPGLQANSISGALMSDVSIGNHLFLGESLGYVNGESKFAHKLGTNKLQSVVGSVYTTFLYEHFYADLIGSFAWNFYDLKRKIPLWDLTAKSHPQGYIGALDLAIGYYINVRQLAITPMLGLNYNKSHTNQFQEKGAQSLNLKIDDFSLNSLQSMCGIRIGKTAFVKTVQLLFEIEGDWEYELLDQSWSVETDLLAYDFPFTMFLPEFNRNLFTGKICLTAIISPHYFIQGSYNASYSHHNAMIQSCSANLGLSF